MVPDSYKTDRVWAYSPGTKARRTYTIEAVHGRNDEAKHLLASALSMVREMKAAGVDPNFIEDFAKGMHDQITDLVGGMKRDLDNDGVGAHFINWPDCAELLEAYK